MKKRNKFNLSHYNLLTASMGILFPVQCQEILPGDTFVQNTSIFMRVMPMVAPVMHPVHVSIHSFFVPLRLIWEDSEDFFTGGSDGMNASIPPYKSSSASQSGKGFAEGELADYLGIPPNVPGLTVSSLPFRAYHLIWNEYYRDQDLQPPVDISLASGDDTKLPGNLQRVCWPKDYFTLARPFEQKGPTVTVPIGAGTGSITGITAETIISGKGTPYFTKGNGGAVHLNAGGQLEFQQGDTDVPIDWTNPNLQASTTISGGKVDGNIGVLDLNDFRQAMAMQRFEEHRALYGSRYCEYLRYLGIRPSDARIQRPEYLGGGRRTIQFSEVLQTAQGDDPVGTLRGHGIAALKTPTFMRFFEEHGFIFTLMSIRPKAIYSQGLPRMFSRKTKYDYYQRELEHIGQQQILNKEVFGKHSDPDGVFGYINRYSEYRMQPSNIHGEFRSVYNDWHLAREFESDPALNSDFVTCHPSNRIFAETTDNYDKFLIMAQNNITARRIMSKRGEPI